MAHLVYFLGFGGFETKRDELRNDSFLVLSESLSFKDALKTHNVAAN